MALKFIKLMANDQRPTIYGDGTQSRDFTYVVPTLSGLKEIFLLPLRNWNPNSYACPVKCEAIYTGNCACHGQITLNELVKEINNLLDKNIEPIYTDPWTGDIKHSFANIELIKAKLNYKPKFLFNTGIELIINWI